MEYKRLNLVEAAKKVIHERIKKLGRECGLIAIDAEGNIAMPFSTECMHRGMKNARNCSTAIY